MLDQLTRDKEIKLTEEEIEEIEKVYSDYSLRVTHRTAPDSVQNAQLKSVEARQHSLFQQPHETKCINR